MKIAIDHVIAQTVEAMLPRFSGSEIGLLFTINANYADYEKNKHVRNTIYLLFIRSANYTKVLSHVIRTRDFLQLGKETEFTKESDHDSCWRSDGLSFLRILDDVATTQFEKPPSEHIAIESIRYVQVTYKAATQENYCQKYLVTLDKYLPLADAVAIIKENIK